MASDSWRSWRSCAAGGDFFLGDTAAGAMFTPNSPLGHRKCHCVGSERPAQAPRPGFHHCNHTQPWSWIASASMSDREALEDRRYCTHFASLISVYTRPLPFQISVKWALQHYSKQLLQTMFPPGASKKGRSASCQCLPAQNFTKRLMGFPRKPAPALPSPLNTTKTKSRLQPCHGYFRLPPIPS